MNRARAYVGLRASAYPDRIVGGSSRRFLARDPSAAHAATPAARYPVPDADWQPGVTAGAAGLRPTLDGQPVPGAVAASAAQGWVDVADPAAEALVGEGRTRLRGVVGLVEDAG